jgi:hypothetical protein
MKEEHELVSEKEASKLLGVSLSVMRKYRCDGISPLKSVSIFGVLKYRRSDIERLMKSGFES